MLYRGENGLIVRPKNIWIRRCSRRWWKTGS